MLETLYLYYISGIINSETRAAVAAYGNKIAEVKGLSKPNTLWAAICLAIEYGIEGIPTPSYSEYHDCWR
jgi:hypothetical protein